MGTFKLLSAAFLIAGITVNGNSIRKSDAVKNFRDFVSHSLIGEIDGDDDTKGSIQEALESSGALSIAPFGIGYNLANLNEKVWNISTGGLSTVLHTSTPAEDYAQLLQLLNQGGVLTSNSLYAQIGKNRTIPTPSPSFEQLKTDLSMVDVLFDWKNAWAWINGRTANGTNSTQPDTENPFHKDNFVPKGGWWGGPFSPATAGIYITTDHYKASWSASSIGDRKFSNDSKLVPFFELDGTYPYYESKNYSGVQISLNGGRQTLSVILPNISMVDFLTHDEETILKSFTVLSRNSQEQRRIQLPTLDLTLMVHSVRHFHTKSANFSLCEESSYYPGPIPQAQFIRFKPDSLELSSATGATVNEASGDVDIDKLFESHAQKPVPVDSSKGSSNSSAEFDSESEENDESASSETASKNGTSSEESSEEASNEIRTTVLPPSLEEETMPASTVRYDKPFYWYLEDEEVGPIFYGVVYSISTSDNDLFEDEEWGWLGSLVKTILWTCENDGRNLKQHVRREHYPIKKDINRYRASIKFAN